MRVAQKLDCSAIIDQTFKDYMAFRDGKLTREAMIELIKSWREFCHVMHDCNMSGNYDVWAIGDEIEIYWTMAYRMANTLVISLDIPDSDDEYYGHLETMEKAHEWLKKWPESNQAMYRRIKKDHAEGNSQTLAEWAEEYKLEEEKKKRSLWVEVDLASTEDEARVFARQAEYIVDDKYQPIKMAISWLIWAERPGMEPKLPTRITRSGKVSYITVSERPDLQELKPKEKT